MDKSAITISRKDEIIESLLDEYMQGITEDGMEILKGVMSEEELAAYGYDLSKTS